MNLYRMCTGHLAHQKKTPLIQIYTTKYSAFTIQCKNSSLLLKEPHFIKGKDKAVSVSMHHTLFL